MRRNEFAAGSIAVAAVLAAIGTFRGDDDHALRQWLIVLLIIAVVAAILFWGIVPRVDRYGRGALILAVIGVVSLIVFWAGVPPLFAGAAAMLALAARAGGTEQGLATAALVLAALTVAAHVVVAFVG